MRAHSYSLGSGCDGCASTFKRGGGGLAIGGGCRGGRSPRRQGRAAPILNTSGSARWFDVACKGLARATSQCLANDVREHKLQANALRVQHPKALQTIHASTTDVVMHICNIQWDIGCDTYYGAADMQYIMGYRMCYVLRRKRAHRIRVSSQMAQDQAL